MVQCNKKGLKMLLFQCFSSGKFRDVRKYVCVKDLTNIMSASGASHVPRGAIVKTCYRYVL